MPKDSESCYNPMNTLAMSRPSSPGRTLSLLFACLNIESRANSMDYVLIVDDDSSIRESVRFILEEVGYTVYEASNGADALDQLRASEQSLIVLLDAHMPLIDGAHVLRIVADDPVLLKRHAYIFMSARLEQLDPVTSSQFPKDMLKTIAKPFELDDLLEVVASKACQLSMLIS
jgi:CheY-like chemotaxis protein